MLRKGKFTFMAVSTTNDSFSGSAPEKRTIGVAPLYRQNVGMLCT